MQLFLRRNADIGLFYRIPPVERIWIVLNTDRCLSLLHISIRLRHCVKSVHVQSYSGPYFPAFGLNKDRNNSEYRHFSRSEDYK